MTEDINKAVLKTNTPLPSHADKIGKTEDISKYFWQTHQIRTPSRSKERPIRNNLIPALFC